MRYYDFFTKNFFQKNDEGVTVFNRVGFIKHKQYVINDLSQVIRLKKIVTAVCIILYSMIFLFIISYIISKGINIIVFLCTFFIVVTVLHLVINHELKNLPVINITFDDKIKPIAVKQVRLRIKMLLIVILILIASIFGLNAIFETLPNPSYNRLLGFVIFMMTLTVVGIVVNVYVLHRKNKLQDSGMLMTRDTHNNQDHS